MIEIERLQDELLECATGDEIWRTVSRELSEIGSMSMMYGCIPVRGVVEKRKLGFTRATLFRSDYDARVIAQLDEQFLDNDLVTYLLFNGEPFVIWQDNSLWDRASPEQIEQARIEFEVGLEQGCSILVPRSMAPSAALSLHFTGMSNREIASVVSLGRSDLSSVAALLDQGLRRADPLYLTKLTPREKELLTFRITTDLSWQRIADAFGVSDGHIKNLRHSMQEKLRAKSFDQAVTVAVKLGLIDF